MEKFVRSVISNTSCYFKHISSKNKGINHVKNLYYHKIFHCLADRWTTQIQRNLAENAAKHKVIHPKLRFLPLRAHPGDEGQEKFLVKFHAYFFFHAEILNVLRLYAETVAFFWQNDKVSFWCEHIKPTFILLQHATGVCQSTLSAQTSSLPCFIFPWNPHVTVRCSHENNLCCFP